MNVVSILAHQDDEMKCLGTMLKCQARGDRLLFITLTDGSKGFVQDPAIAREEAARIRHAEMSSLAEALGGAYLNLREPDEFLYDTPEVRMKLIEAIRKTQADLIFTHFRQDYNLDHTTVSSLVRHCAMHAYLPVLPTESPPLKEHPAIFMVEPIGPFEFSPTHYVDITGYHERKTVLLRHHRSQEEALQKTLGAGLAEMTSTSSRYHGEQTGCGHAEGFIPMRARGAMKPYNTLP